MTLGKGNRCRVDAPLGIHVVVKPVGPACNLKCEYCFYLEKEALFPAGADCRMSDAVLSRFVSSYIENQSAPEVEFVWQGGEPTLAGLDFYHRVVELQRPYSGQKTIRNSLQTNGTLLSDEWCKFLKHNRFMVGLSLDGPREVHDRYRRDSRGEGTFDSVVRGLRLLQRHGVEFNVMACVARETAQRPLEVYRFFREQGVEFVQFLPIMERLPNRPARDHGLRLAVPVEQHRPQPDREVTDWTVSPEAYGDFLIAIYEEWVRRDVGMLYVMNFEWALNAWIGNPSPVCIHARQCGRSVALEHNGDLYPCDHYVYPEFKLGNIMADGLSQLVEKSLVSGFGVAKEASLPRSCRECPVLAACQGGCPKGRIGQASGLGPGRHYLCAGYKKFFLHIRKYLQTMTTLLANGLPVSEVMKAVQGPLVIRSESHRP